MLTDRRKWEGWRAEPMTEPEQADPGARSGRVPSPADGGGMEPELKPVKDAACLLVSSTPGIHASDARAAAGELVGLCGSSGAFGSPQLVTCPRCLERMEPEGNSQKDAPIGGLAR